jgi:hypothetical protein
MCIDSVKEDEVIQAKSFERADRNVSIDVKQLSQYL